nr:phosphate-starvation-inducible PsiE family protein [Acetobacter oryzifermentans]
MLVTAIATVHLISAVWHLIVDIGIDPIKQEIFQEIFGAIFTVIIALEFKHSLLVVLAQHENGLVTVLCRSSERFKLVSGDRRNHEAYGRFQARGRKDCVEQWVVTHACCGRSGYWQIHSGEMDSELSSGRAGIRASG